MNGLYIHIPFCHKKCNYCDFASYPEFISKSDEYIDALCREMQLYKGEKVNTVYVGGGTPSILTNAQIGKIIDNVTSVFDVSADSEITIEVNPCTADLKKAEFLHSIGFNRVSIGAQSFVDSELLSLGRLHKAENTKKAFYDFRSAGFKNISLDLMYAIPGQTPKSLSTSLGEMLNLAPEHISCYGLKIEEGTPFATMLSEKKITEKTDDEYADMYEIICKNLTENGYFQYELSNFSKKDFESKHNIKYWTLNDYIGLGLSASSCYKGKRYTRTADFKQYIKNFENTELYELSKDEKMSEFMILSLRLTGMGASKKLFKQMFSKTIEDVFSLPLKKHLKGGFIIDSGDCYVLSKKAYYISNAILCDFI
ncbi:MAG: radical SAM family heme chaperone HemW [Clostridia bacterium]|nr:radical SAM family heme chaperone HemW [Clostridia bacterium]